MKYFLKLSLISLFVLHSAFANDNNFPLVPVETQTPGKLCTTPSERRYPEQIAYCNRKVDSYLKNAIIAKYDTLFGFEISSMKRLDFKIDHLIPLCAGGANSEENLWPQHKSVFAVTDPMEPVICEKMAQGRIKQAEAVKLILKAKFNLLLAPVIYNELQKL